MAKGCRELCRPNAANGVPVTRQFEKSMRHVRCALDKIRDILFVSSCEATLKMWTFYRTGKQTSPRLAPRFWRISKRKKEKWIPYVLTSFSHGDKQSNQSSGIQEQRKSKGYKNMTDYNNSRIIGANWPEGKAGAVFSFMRVYRLMLYSWGVFCLYTVQWQAQWAALFIYFSHVPGGLKFHEARAVTLFQFWCDP